MKPFLNDVAADFALPPSGYEAQAFILNMHALPSIAKLVGLILNAGAKPENMLFIGKPYSTIRPAQYELCQRNIKFISASSQFRPGALVSLHEDLLTKELSRFVAERRDKEFVLLDSGGHLTNHFDALNTGLARTSIQLTSSGSRKFAPNAQGLIDIGSLSLKKDSESALIAREILRVIRLTIPDLAQKDICVVGQGAMGNAVTQSLATENIKHSQISGLNNHEMACATPDIIIGATGYDISALIEHNDRQKPIALFSASSWDVEFRNLLLAARMIVDLNKCTSSFVTIPRSCWTVHNGGCPINFDRVSEMAQQKDGEPAIAMTRGLTLAAALRPVDFAENVPRVAELYKKHYG
jgi:hypothetical protein